MNYLIITGSPLDGFEFVGSFVDITPALNFARRAYGDDNWWVKELVEPGENTSRPDSVLRSSILQLKTFSNTRLCKALSEYMKDKQIVYKDGNCRNYNIDNLELVPINDISDKERIDAKLGTILDNEYDEQDFADRESYASSLPGIEDHDILDRVSEDDLPL